jgi:hypothetical protein
MRQILVAVGASLAVLALVAGAWVAYHHWAPHDAPAGQPTLASLTPENLDDFRELFNAAAGDARVMILLSPT